MHDGDVRPGIPLLTAAAGALDGDAASCLGIALDGALDRRPWGLVLDLSRVDRVAPAGLTLLLRVAAAAGEDDVGLCLVCSDAVRSALAGAGLHELFDQHPGVAEALDALGVTDEGGPG